MSWLFRAVIRSGPIFFQAFQDAFRASNDTNGACKPHLALVGRLFHFEALLLQGALTLAKLLKLGLHHGRLSE